jgi:CBS-domain-containing membrane protein
MNISDCMKLDVVSIPATSTIRETADVFVKKHIGLLPVLDKDSRVVGVVSLRHLLSLELPDFVNFIADLDYVHDFGAVETTRPPADVLDRSITTLMNPETAGLLRTYALLLQHNLHDMPVVSADGKLVGIASRVDIGTAILSAWAKVA